MARINTAISIRQYLDKCLVVWALITVSARSAAYRYSGKILEKVIQKLHLVFDMNSPSLKFFLGFSIEVSGPAR